MAYAATIRSCRRSKVGSVRPRELGMSVVALQDTGVSIRRGCEVADDDQYSRVLGELMATQQQIHETTAAMGRLPSNIELCESLALALLETGQSLRGFFSSTDYERSSAQNITSIRQILRQITQMRKDTLSPDLVRAHSRISNMHRCCQECPEVNEQRLAKKKEPFRCLIKERCGTAATTIFRFTLDDKGNLHESH